MADHIERSEQTFLSKILSARIISGWADNPLCYDSRIYRSVLEPATYMETTH